MKENRRVEETGDIRMLVDGGIRVIKSKDIAVANTHQIVAKYKKVRFSLDEFESDEPDTKQWILAIKGTKQIVLKVRDRDHAIEETLRIIGNYKDINTKSFK